MVDWKDPSVIAAEASDFNNLVHVFFGLYTWELISSASFEVSLVKGKRKVGWRLVRYVVEFIENVEYAFIDRKAPFFLCRYGMLWALIGLVISLNVSTKVNCGALYTFISVAGNTTIASASTSLMIRTLALWEWERWVTITIGILSLGQWSILIHGMNIVHAAWDESTNACVVDNTNHLLLNLNYFFTMTFDFVILIFTSIALARLSRERSGLSTLLFRDGLIYFMVTSMCNTIPAVLNVLNLNDEMNVIATIPAATTSAIAACRAVIRLRQYGERTNSHSLPTLNFVSTISNRYKKASFVQTHRRTDARSLDELGTSTSGTESNAPKSASYVEWTREGGAHDSVELVIKKTTESQPMSPEHDALPSAV